MPLLNCAYQNCSVGDVGPEVEEAPGILRCGYCSAQYHRPCLVAAGTCTCGTFPVDMTVISLGTALQAQADAVRAAADSDSDSDDDEPVPSPTVVHPPVALLTEQVQPVAPLAAPDDEPVDPPWEPRCLQCGRDVFQVPDGYDVWQFFGRCSSNPIGHTLCSDHFVPLGQCPADGCTGHMARVENGALSSSDDDDDDDAHGGHGGHDDSDDDGPAPWGGPPPGTGPVANDAPEIKAYPQDDFE